MEVAKYVEWAKANKKKIAATLVAVTTIVTIWASNNTIAYRLAELVKGKAAEQAQVEPAPVAPAPEAK